MPLSHYVSSLNEEQKALYFKKLKNLGFGHKDDPFLVDEFGSEEHYIGKWSKSTETWPEVKFGDVYMYLIDCPGYTHKSLKAFKSLEAYQCFMNGLVHQLYIQHSCTGHCIIKGHVSRSEDISDKPYQAWVGLKSGDASIVTGHCTCMTSALPVCVHVAAIIFQVEATPRSDCSKEACCCARHCKKQTDQKQKNDASTANNDTSTSSCPSISQFPGVEETQSFQNNPNAVPDFSDNNENVDQIYPGEANSQDEGMHITLEMFQGMEGNNALMSNTEDNIEYTSIVVFPCERCELAFTDRPLLDTHMKQAHQEDYLKYVEEGEKPGIEIQLNAFPTNVDDTSQEKTPHVNECNIHSCKLCHLTFPTIPLLESHVKNQHNEDCLKLLKEETESSIINAPNQSEESDTLSEQRPLKCELCNKNFKSSTQFLRHARIHTRQRRPKRIRTKVYRNKDTGEIMTECDECGKECETSSFLREHKKTHTGEKPFKCKVCFARFRFKSSLTAHEKRHVGEGPFQCAECGKSFNARNNLRSHVKRHSSERLAMCHECGKSFLDASVLRQHMKIHSGEKPFKCEECGRSFTERSDLKRHMLRHAEKPYKCSVCAMRFRLPESLQGHMRIHTENNICDICGKVFLNSGARASHMRSHLRPKATPHNKRTYIKTDGGDKSVVKNYPCHFCNKVFASFPARYAHLRTHTGEKPYLCKVCGKRFSLSGNFRRHMRIHTGEKPYKCNVCDKSFTQSNILMVHMRTHTGEKPYKCNDCGQAFGEKRGLQKHFKTAHSHGGQILTQVNIPLEIEQYYTVEVHKS